MDPRSRFASHLAAYMLRVDIGPLVWCATESENVLFVLYLAR